MNDIARLRLINQQISAGRCTTPDAAVRTLGALQAQDYSSTLWAIALRLPGSTQTDVEQAFAQHRIVRTWAMRGTIHFLAGKEVRWMLELLAPRVLSGTGSRDLRLDATTFARSRTLLENALQGGKQAQRDEVYAVLERGNISTDGQRGYHILWQLGLQGVICFGLHQGKRPTFTLLDEWVPESRMLDREAALAELASRYFNGHGPATVQDFATWTKLSLTEARLAQSAVAEKLQTFELDGVTYWLPQDMSDPVPKMQAALLPAFDEYLLGYKDRSAVLAKEHADKIVPGGNGMFLPIMVLNGRVVGTWKRTLAKTSVNVAYAPFGKLKKTELSAFDVAAQRYGEFLGLMVE